MGLAVLLACFFFFLMLCVAAAAGWWFFLRRQPTVLLTIPATSVPITSAPVTPTPPPVITLYVYNATNLDDTPITSWPVDAPTFSSLAQVLGAYPATAALTATTTGTVTLRNTMTSPKADATAITYTLTPLAGATAIGKVPVATTTPTQYLFQAITAALSAATATATTLPPGAAAQPAFSRSGATVGFGSAGRLLSCKGTQCTPGGGLRVIGPYAGTAQQWTYDPAAQTLTSAGLCLEVGDFATADHSGIDTWMCNSGANQQWVATPTGTGYQLKNPFSGKCLNVVGGADADGTPVELLTCSGAASQVWT